MRRITKVNKQTIRTKTAVMAEKCVKCSTTKQRIAQYVHNNANNAVHGIWYGRGSVKEGTAKCPGGIWQEGTRNNTNPQMPSTTTTSSKITQTEWECHECQMSVRRQVKE